MPRSCAERLRDVRQVLISEYRIKSDAFLWFICNSLKTMAIILYFIRDRKSPRGVLCKNREVSGAAVRLAGRRKRVRLQGCEPPSQEGFAGSRRPCLLAERSGAPTGPFRTAIALARDSGKDKLKKPAGRSQNRKQCYFPRLCWRTRSSWSRDIFVATNNSCLAPLESAIAFQPVRVGVVIRIFTGPFASRTRRIRPGMIVAMDEQFPSSLSRTGRRPSIIECSTLRRLLAARSLTVVAYGFDGLI